MYDVTAIGEILYSTAIQKSETKFKEIYSFTEVRETDFKSIGSRFKELRRMDEISKYKEEYKFKKSTLRKFNNLTKEMISRSLSLIHI